MPRIHEMALLVSPLVREKIVAFGHLLPIFLASFTYIEQLHRKQRFPRSPSLLLRALWVCNCKGTDEARCEIHCRGLGAHDEVLVTNG